VLRTVLERIWSRGPIILLYHRVADLDSDPQMLAVSEDNFTSQMELIARKYHPMSLASLVDDYRKGEFRKNGIVVTFDDGYHDNLVAAKPILDRFGIPATFFVTSGNIATGREFWWDELEKVFFRTPILPESLEIEVAGFVYSGSLAQSRVMNQEEYTAAVRWNVLESGNPTGRHSIYRDVCVMAKTATFARRSELLDYLHDWARIKSDARESHRPLTKEELKELASDRMIEIGAHGDNHMTFSVLSRGEQEMEIGASQSLIEAVTGKKPVAFSYPYGNSSDYSPQTVSLVKKHKFQYACSNFTGLIGKRSDSFQLPRFLVRNWDANEFAHNVRRRIGE
jgi:peptidoglycan/xylan/chitin deacetylase (PgdA/CDA1 family)